MCHEALSGPEGAAIFAGNQLPPGAHPIAQAYAGHQYGHFTTLGDGRVMLLFTPGHTPGHQSLFINLPKTGAVIPG